MTKACESISILAANCIGFPQRDIFLLVDKSTKFLDTTPSCGINSAASNENPFFAKLSVIEKYESLIRKSDKPTSWVRWW